MKVLLLGCLFTFVPTMKQVFAEDNGGGNITTPGKITFEVEESKEPVPKPKPKPDEKVIEGKKFLPKTGEEVSIFPSFIGMISILLVGSYCYLHNKREQKGGEQS